MPTITNIWPGRKKIPIELMDNDHIKFCYRMCWWVIYLRKAHKRMEIDKFNDFLKSYYEIYLTHDAAEKWVEIFKLEGKKRKMHLIKPDELTYMKSIDIRNNKRLHRRDNNENFDNLFI